MKTRPRRVQVDEIEHHLDWIDPHATPAWFAQRFGVSIGGIYAALERANRLDLKRRLLRNKQAREPFGLIGTPYMKEAS